MQNPARAKFIAFAFIAGLTLTLFFQNCSNEQPSGLGAPPFSTTGTSGGTSGGSATPPGGEFSRSSSSKAIDSKGNFYVANGNADTICQWNSQSGATTRFAGATESAAFPTPTGGLALDASGDLYVSSLDTTLDPNNGLYEVNLQTGAVSVADENLFAPQIAFASDGDFYVDSGGGCGGSVLSLTLPQLTSTTIAQASCASPIVPGDGGLATQAGFGSIAGFAMDNSGHLYIADAGLNTIREVNLATDIISTVAGTGADGDTGNGGPATSAELNLQLSGSDMTEWSSDIATDSSGNVYVSEPSSGEIREINTQTGVISVYAQNLSNPTTLAFDSKNNLYVSQSVSQTPSVARIDSGTGQVSVIAGNGTSGFAGDGGAAVSAEFGSAFFMGLAVDQTGNIYVSDGTNQSVREINMTTGNISTIAGRYQNPGGLATNTYMGVPSHVAVDNNGNLYFVDSSYGTIREVDAASGDMNILENVVRIDSRSVPGIVLDPTNSYLYYVNDGSVYKLNLATDQSALFAGTEWSMSAGGALCQLTCDVANEGDGGLATAARFADPVGLAVDLSGNLLITDFEANVIREVNASTGIVTLLAGTGVAGYSGDGGPATSATFNEPSDAIVDWAGNIYIADSSNHVVREINAKTGIITTVAGNGKAGDSGDGGLATQAELNKPVNLDVDGAGNLYILDSNSGAFGPGSINVVREVNAQTGLISTVGSNPISCP